MDAPQDQDDAGPFDSPQRIQELEELAATLAGVVETIEAMVDTSDPDPDEDVEPEDEDLDENPDEDDDLDIVEDESPDEGGDLDVVDEGDL